ncbi:sugar phosphate isomerase/epimerase family protein [Metabacillus halosaccharovorans]|uniref:sugar phosphate isomerase/epimerase family protein n=1 Tax=Metabacillus halosaccharovorans TaxID=930124 RepID=UPI00203F31C9|nr:sugar phosphate isomerase/epimerase [Metabacillus halosaccharovorans]MCM3439733.1 sugar phosphate isomerase/epimerase [Metabacillus halosaccharovorans]
MGKLIAVQLFTLRDECEQDFYGTLEKVAALGFNGVELAGYYGKEAVELKQTLDNLGLVAVSSHVSLERMEQHLENEIAYLKTLNCKNIVCPYLVEDRRNEYDQLAQTLNKVGERCSEEGIALSYHNHDFELEKREGRSHLERLFDETNPEYVKAELDVYWLTLAGEDPVDWMKKYTGRMPLIHLKDMTTDSDKTFAELGTGGVNLEAILHTLDEAKVEWMVVEQDKCKRSPLESVEISINYLKDQLSKVN